ncbi:DUF5985 family protein [Microvirga massiliensis]|uniref:DUF5985 family protein n=1 Tax=Microvirga massiliensis TaxID=1033741 RepID=UPI00062BAAC4|nr:DUF5985 family protein [Microvirga massiliensis]
MNPTLQAFVYTLCLLTSAACAALLVRRYLESRARLLLWSALCFVLLAVNNFFVVLDVLIIPTISFVPARQLASLSAVSLLLFGFIWDTD